MTIANLKNAKIPDVPMPMSNSEVQSPHILIMDDDPDQLRLLVAALRNASYRVSVALNGDQGYARATVLLPDLIFLDVRMPGRNGITIARLLKANPATEDIPIIFISALVDQHERLAGLRAGAVDYICKPFHVDEILERTRIHLALSQKKSIPPVDNTERIIFTGNKIPAASLPANLLLRQIASEYIFSHINEPSLKSSDVASSMQVPMRRLNSLFEASDGISVFEFIRQERMRRAALMLGQSTLTIAEIAIEVGYPNPANFSTEFKKFWKKSPTQFRNESQADPSFLPGLIPTKLSS